MSALPGWHSTKPRAFEPFKLTWATIANLICSSLWILGSSCGGFSSYSKKIPGSNTCIPGSHTYKKQKNIALPDKIAMEKYEESERRPINLNVSTPTAGYRLRGKWETRSVLIGNHPMSMIFVHALCIFNWKPCRLQDPQFCVASTQRHCRNVGNQCKEIGNGKTWRAAPFHPPCTQSTENLNVCKEPYAQQDNGHIL